MKTITIAAGILVCCVSANAQMKSGAAPPSPGPVLKATPVPAEATSESARRIEIDEAVKQVKANKAVIVDVRNKEAFDEGHIAGSLNIPLNELIPRLKEIPPHRTIIAYCA